MPLLCRPLRVAGDHSLCGKYHGEHAYVASCVSQGGGMHNVAGGVDSAMALIQFLQFYIFRARHAGEGIEPLVYHRRADSGEI